MQNIDFSSKHHILIRSEDGSLTPMDEPYYYAEQIAPGTWRVLSDGDYTYLVQGDAEALVIDSGYGAGNIRAFCQTLTDKPITRIANTHDHFDHTANNCYFDCAYMSEETQKKATLPFPSFEGINFPRDYPVRIIGEGYVFHLGNRDLETFSIPDHATGSLAFWDRSQRILFSGDELMGWAKNLNGSVERFAAHLEKLMVHRAEFDRLCAGEGILDASYVERYLACAKQILAGQEGQPLPAPSSSPASAAAMSAGDTIIYDRFRPRPCDIPHGDGSDRPFRRVLQTNGVQIIYDVRRVFEHGKI